MKVTNTNGIEIVEFESIYSFLDYVENAKVNPWFVGRESSKQTKRFYTRFTKTSCYGEAKNLMLNGWTEKAKELEKEMAKAKTTATKMSVRTFADVAGYQPIVPAYLMGLPKSMINSKLVPMKQKVVTLVKSINYSVSVSTSTITEESIKALQIVKNLESQGIRVNLYISFGAISAKNDKKVNLRIKIKSSSEKLNISKVAFPMVHPSMLRRMFFRFEEVYPSYDSSFVGGYGRPFDNNLMKMTISRGEYVIPAFVSSNIDKIKNIEELQKIN